MCGVFLKQDSVFFYPIDIALTTHADGTADNNKLYRQYFDLENFYQYCNMSKLDQILLLTGAWTS